MENKLDLRKVLKNAKGIKLYTDLIGNVEFVGVDFNLAHPIIVRKGCRYLYFFENGRYLDHDCGEIQLFPSKTNRDWSTFIAPLEKNTPLMCKNKDEDKWHLDYFGFYDLEKNINYTIDCNAYDFMIPYEKFNVSDIKESLNYNIQENYE